MSAKEAAKLLGAARAGNEKAFASLFAGLDAGKDRDLLNRALVQAVWGGSPFIVERLLGAGANPEQTTLVGTLLMGAAMSGHLAIARHLIEAGASLNREVKRETALSAALSENQIEVIEYLEGLGATSPPSTTLVHASTHGDLPRARRAIAEGAELDCQGGIFEETPLMAAARKGHVEIVRLLLRRGANPNQRVHGRTALFEAAERGAKPGTLEIAELLFAAGADIRARNCDDTVLMAAGRGGSLALVRRLVELGVDVQARDKQRGMTALDYAKRENHKQVVKYLAGLGAMSERSAGHALVRALARDFGGKVIEHSHGFMLNTRFHGMKCQFGVETGGVSLFVNGLDFGQCEWKRAQDSHLAFAVCNLEFPGQKAQEVKGVFRGSNLRVFVLRGVGALSPSFASSFSRKHKARLEAVKLSGRECLRIGGGFASIEWPLLDVALVRQRLGVFASFLQGMARPPRPERRLFEREWQLKPVRGRATGSTTPVHRLGGSWPEPVACPRCQRTANLMAQVDLSDPALPKTALGRALLPVFWCLACLEWNAMFFDLSKEPPRPWGRNAGSRKAGKPKAGVEDLPERRLKLVPVAVGRTVGRKGKLGGGPQWIQMDETPDCPKCEQPMAFVLQLASDSRVSYGDAGMFYSFACPDCRTSASLIQSH